MVIFQSYNSASSIEQVYFLDVRKFQLNNISTYIGK